MYPSFVRTVPSNKDLIDMIIHIIQWFGWNWIAFLGGRDDYSEDGLRLFNTFLSNTGICLAYQEVLSQKTNYSQTLEKIDMLNINVIVVFAEQQYASNILKAAIANDVRDKVWIASETWSMNQQLPREPGIEKIGTIIGITERFLSLHGFDEFIYKERRSVDDAGHNHNDKSQVKSQTCNQDCDCCMLLTAEEIISENPTFTFGIYSAIYTIAHALHEVLQCDVNACDKNTTAKPYMVSKLIIRFHQQSSDVNSTQAHFENIPLYTFLESGKYVPGAMFLSSRIQQRPLSMLFQISDFSRECHSRLLFLRKYTRGHCRLTHPPPSQPIVFSDVPIDPPITFHKPNRQYSKAIQ